MLKLRAAQRRLSADLFSFSGGKTDGGGHAEPLWTSAALQPPGPAAGGNHMAGMVV